MGPRAELAAMETYGPVLRMLVRAGFARRLAADFDEWAIQRALELLCEELSADAPESKAAQTVIRSPEKLKRFCVSHPMWMRRILEAR